MPHFFTRAISIVSVLSVFMSGPAIAENQTFTIMLGNRQLGSLVFDGNGSNASLLSKMDNTPLGVANGTFNAVTRAKDGDVASVLKSRGKKTRDISILREVNTVTTVTVTPKEEMTEMTDASKVPIGVISPPEVFAVLANGGTCPPPMVMYDGRRVVQMSTIAMKPSGASLICDMSYNVVMGPGHLSPFRFKSFKMQIVYTARKLDTVTITAGGFNVNLIRQ